MTGFVHLRCRSEYSLGESIIQVPELCCRAIELGLDTVALTDSNNLHGALHFYKTAKEYGLKPIIGCEFRVSRMPSIPGPFFPRSEFQLMLLARNQVGYQNLIQLVTKAHLEGVSSSPLVTKKMLAKHQEGLIALSSGLKGEVAYQLLHASFSAGLEAAQQYASIFPGCFCLEIQHCSLQKQVAHSEQLTELAEALELDLIATNDCRYLYPEDSEAFGTFLRMQGGSEQSGLQSMHINGEDLHYCSPQEMKSTFAHIPKALDNTLQIAQWCNLEMKSNPRHFPAQPPYKDTFREEELREKAWVGLEQRLQHMDGLPDRTAYQERLNHELEIICLLGVAEYFLILEDVVSWSKTRGIPLGPGRGSAPGSLVNYVLGITDINPLPYGLLFEPFLNLQNQSIPAISMDICDQRREEVFSFIKDRYGQDKAVWVISFLRKSLPEAIREVGNAMGVDESVLERLAGIEIRNSRQLAPRAGPGEALESNPETKALVESDFVYKTLFWRSWKLTGLVKGFSVHAAAVALVNRSKTELAPLRLNKQGEPITQWKKRDLEESGVCSFDFLGLRYLSLIIETLNLAKEAGKPDPDISHLPLNDTHTYTILAQGETDGVFQFECAGIRKLLQELRPTCLEHLAALLALYRPRPLKRGIVQEYLERKKGQLPAESPFSELDPILKETYGLLIYQEQIERIAGLLAGYAPDEAHTLHNTMAQYDPPSINLARERFMHRARISGIDQSTAEQVFEFMSEHAPHVFRKSQSIAYSILSYRIAYLKAHYSNEFLMAKERILDNNTQVAT